MKYDTPFDHFDIQIFVPVKMTSSETTTQQHPNTFPSYTAVGMWVIWAFNFSYLIVWLTITTNIPLSQGETTAKNA